MAPKLSAKWPSWLPNYKEHACVHLYMWYPRDSSSGEGLAYIYIEREMYVSIDISVCIYIYVCTYVYVCTCTAAFELV